MRQQVEKALGALIGLPLWSSGRASSLQWFQFGERTSVISAKGIAKQVGTYALHVQCAWRLAGGSIIAASSDRYYPAGDPFKETLSSFDWDIPGANRCDERIETFFSEANTELLTVKQTFADVFGGFRLLLGTEYVLEVFPDSSVAMEHWRLFRPNRPDTHFVVVGSRIEQQ